MRLPSRQAKAQRIAQAIYGDMDFGAKPATTATQRLLPTFFVRQRHTDGHAQSCCQSSRFPCQGRVQNGRTSAATPRFRTSVRSVCKCYSSSHNALAASAIAPHCGLPTSLLRRIGDKRLHLYPHRLVSLVAESPVFLSIDGRLGSHLSCAYFTALLQMSTQPSNQSIL